MINTSFERLKARNFFTFPYLSFYEQLKFCAQLRWAWKKFYNLEAWFTWTIKPYFPWKLIKYHENCHLLQAGLSLSSWWAKMVPAFKLIIHCSKYLKEHVLPFTTMQMHSVQLLARVSQIQNTHLGVSSALDKLLCQLGTYATWLSSIAYLQKQLPIFIFFLRHIFFLWLHLFLLHEAIGNVLAYLFTPMVCLSKVSNSRILLFLKQISSKCVYFAVSLSS